MAGNAQDGIRWAAACTSLIVAADRVVMMAEVPGWLARMPTPFFEFLTCVALLK